MQRTIERVFQSKALICYTNDMLGFLINLIMFPIKLAFVLLNLAGRLGSVLLGLLLNPLVIIIVLIVLAISMLQ